MRMQYIDRHMFPKTERLSPNIPRNLNALQQTFEPESCKPMTQGREPFACSTGGAVPSRQRGSF